MVDRPSTTMVAEPFPPATWCSTPPMATTESNTVNAVLLMVNRATPVLTVMDAGASVTVKWVALLWGPGTSR